MVGVYWLRANHNPNPKVMYISRPNFCIGVLYGLGCIKWPSRRLFSRLFFTCDGDTACPFLADFFAVDAALSISGLF